MNHLPEMCSEVCNTHKNQSVFQLWTEKQKFWFFFSLISWQASPFPVSHFSSSFFFWLPLQEVNPRKKHSFQTQPSNYFKSMEWMTFLFFPQLRSEEGKDVWFKNLLYWKRMSPTLFLLLSSFISFKFPFFFLLLPLLVSTGRQTFLESLQTRFFEKEESLIPSLPQFFFSLFSLLSYHISPLLFWSPSSVTQMTVSLPHPQLIPFLWFAKRIRTEV